MFFRRGGAVAGSDGLYELGVGCAGGERDSGAQGRMTAGGRGRRIIDCKVSGANDDSETKAACGALKEPVWNTTGEPTSRPQHGQRGSAEIKEHSALGCENANLLHADFGTTGGSHIYG
jgi:hypothetical protein